MKLSIHTIRRTIFTGETPRVTLPTITGEITVLENHEPYVTVLGKGELRYEVKLADRPEMLSEGEGKLAIKGGFLEVRGDNEARILVDE